jgi:hypothetical protein
MNEHEQQYVTHDLELAWIVYALNMWRHYLFGRIFVLMKNDRGMKYLFDHPWLNVRQKKWMELIREFDFEIKHIKGKENEVAYALNRSVQKMHLAATNVGETDIKERIRTLLKGDKFFNLVREGLQ